MGRLLLACVVCLAAAGAALAQVPPEPASPQPGPTPSPIAGCENASQARWEQVSRTHIRYSGAVQIECASGTRFFADSIEMFLDTNTIVLTGNVVFANAEGQISAERAEFDVAAGTGTFHMAAGIMGLGGIADPTQFAGQDADVYFIGERIEKLSGRQYRLTNGSFTTCVQPTPRWEVASRSVTINLDDYAFARNTVLRVKGVPLLYLPVMYYPIRDEERSTGFLMPTYGTSTIRGQAVSNAFFWAIGRSQDATFFHDWFTRAGQGAGVEYRYVADAQSGGEFRVYGFSRREARFGTGQNTSNVLPASNSVQVTATVNQRLGSRLRGRAFVDYFSDVLTQQLYQQGLFQATQGRQAIEGSLTGTFGLVSTSASYQRNQILRSATSSSVYGNAPRVSANVAPRMLFGLPLYGSVTTDYAVVKNQELTSGAVTVDRTLNRWDLAPSLRLPLSSLTYLSVNTSAAYRTTYYSRSLDARGELAPVALLRQFLSLRSEVIGPVLTKIWDTPTSNRTERMKHVIEPTVSVDYTTEIANQTQVPRTNDQSDTVVGGTTRMTYGVTNRLFYRARPNVSEGAGAGLSATGSTREFVTIGVQQTYYSNPQASLFDTTYTSSSNRPRSVTLSPVSLTTRVSPTQTLDANLRIEYDVAGNGLQVLSAGGTLNAATASMNVNFSRQRPSPASQVTSYVGGSTSLRFLEGRVTGQYSLNWDISRAYIVNQSAVASYMAQCCGFQVEAQNFNYPSSIGIPVTADRRFNVSVVLAGLGSFSNFFGAFGGQR
jgi:LPS-assembly protein